MTHPSSAGRIARYDDIRSRLPQEAVAQLSDLEDDDTVLWCDGDLRLQRLDLDADAESLAPGRPGGCRLLVVAGNLVVDGAVTHLPQAPPCHLVVLGDLHAGDVVLADLQLHVEGSLQVEGLLWGSGDGKFRATGPSRVRVEAASGNHDSHYGPLTCDHLIHEDLMRINARPFTGPRLSVFFTPLCLRSDPDSRDALDAVLSLEAMVAGLRRGEAVLQDPLPAPLPWPSTDLTLDNLCEILSTARFEEGRSSFESWVAHVHFKVECPEVDAQGQPRQGHVVVTVRDCCQLQAGIVERPVPRRAANWWRREPPVLALQLLGRRLGADADDGGADWMPLEELDEVDDETAGACHGAWYRVLEEARQARAQREAGYPLWRQAQAEIDAERVRRLVSLPLFARGHRGEPDDGSCQGYWNESLWLGAAQPARHEGGQHTAKFEMGWKPDDESPQVASYLMEVIEPSSDGAARVAFWAMQYDGEEGCLLPRHAGHHWARLLQWFGIAESRVLADNAAWLAEEAEAERLQSTLSLLQGAPWSPAQDDTEVFTAEALAWSERWRAAGRARASQINGWRHGTPAEGSASEPEGRTLEDDPRTGLLRGALVLARKVNRLGDEGVFERFSRLFPFAPDAVPEDEHAQHPSLGPVFIVDARRTVVRVGEPWDADMCFHLLEPGRVTALPGLQGLGRSPDRRCWAECRDGVVTTRQGFDSPRVLARFTLPDGSEGLPADMAGPTPLAARCDQLIPFSDGQRVLLCNPTGVYLLSADGAARLHPRDATPESPYRWPKNQDSDGTGLSLHMVHMALSPDERFIALGDQDSRHLLLHADGRIAATHFPASSYPHHAIFSADGRQVAFNACHFHGGATVQARTDGLDASDELPVIDRQLRVYCGIAQEGGYLAGGAFGYVHLLSDEPGPPGSEAPPWRWRHHIGGTITGIDLGEDGRHLVVASARGWVVDLLRNPGTDEFRVGDSTYSERWRWLFRDGEAGPLRW